MFFQSCIFSSEDVIYNSLNNTVINWGLTVTIKFAKIKLCCLLLAAVWFWGCSGRGTELAELHVEKIRESDRTIPFLFDLDDDGEQEVILYEEEKFIRQDGNSSIIKKISFLSHDFVPLQEDIHPDEKGSLNIRRDPENQEIYLGITYVKDGNVEWKEYNRRGDEVNHLVLAQVKDVNRNGMWEGYTRLVTFLDADNNGSDDPVFVISAFYDLEPRKIAAFDLATGRAIWEKNFDNYIDVDNVKVFDQNGDGEKELVFSTCSIGNRSSNPASDQSYSQLMVVDRQGEVVWNKNTGEKYSQCNLISVGGFSAENKNEIVLLRRSMAGAAVKSDAISVFEASDGEMTEVFSPEGKLQKEILVADLNGDGNNEIIAVTQKGVLKRYDNTLSDSGLMYSLGEGAKVLTMAAFDFYRGQEQEMKTGLQMIDQNKKELLVLTSDGRITVLDHNLKIQATSYLTDLNLNDVYKPCFFTTGDSSQHGMALLHAGGLYSIGIESAPGGEVDNLQVPITIGAVFLVGILLFLLLQRSTELDHEKLKVRQILASEKDRGLLILRNRLQVDSVNEAVFSYLKSDNLDFLWDESEVKGNFEAKIKELLERLDQSSGVELSENGITAFHDSDGNQKIVDISTRKIIDHREEKHGYLVVIKDTWQKQWAKMAAENVNIGQELMHKIKTLISVYRNDIYMLKNLIESHENEEDLNEILDEMFSVSEDITEVTKVFLALSKTEASMLESTDLNALLVETVKPLENKTPDISFNYELEDELPTTLLDREQMQSLILNLVENSQRALENGGNITIKTDMFRKMQESEESGLLDYISFTVEDDGPGFNDEIAQNILEPGFSGFPGRVGLGLTISKRIVDHHNGELIISSIEGKGTTVTVRLPYRG